MMKPLRNSISLLLLALLFYGCNSAPEKYIPKVYQVQIKDMKFEPAELTVNKGDTVIWTNLDITVDDITDQTAESWTSGPLPSGKSWKMVVKKESDYYCSIHKVMTGKILLDE
jgi:plastocyanin